MAEFDNYIKELQNKILEAREEYDKKVDAYIMQMVELVSNLDDLDDLNNIRQIIEEVTNGRTKIDHLIKWQRMGECWLHPSGNIVIFDETSKKYVYYAKVLDIGKKHEDVD
jgi:hypothetical protein